MIKLFISAISLLVLFSVLVQAEETAAVRKEPELIFSSATEVSPRTEITAYDIVEAKNMNEELLSALKTVQVADEKLNKIEKNELAKRLRHLKAKFILPSEVKIMRSKNFVSRMEVERKIKNHIQMNCGECDLQVQVSSVPYNLANDWSLDLNVDLSKNNVMIPIFSMKQPDKKGWVVAEIKRYQMVPVLNQSAKMGDVISAEMITIEKRQIFNLRETALNPRSVIGMQAAHFISAGQSFNFSDLKKEQVVKKGQIVKAMVGNQSFEVSLSAQVEEAGCIGDIVKIKNLDSQKVFAAKVVDRGIVRIE